MGSKKNIEQEHKPYISANTVLPEVTIKAVLLGLLLSMVLAAANAYLGLFAGMTVSASIPAAVMSMAIFRLFKKSNILENNCVQTAASAGESLAAGMIFTLPALVLMGYWQDFNYWETTFIALTGGILGVLFTIPLRSALIIRQKLRFPEGIATAEVLKTGTEGKSSVLPLATAALIGAFFKLCEAGFQLWEGVFERAKAFGGAYVYGGFNVSPALLAVGYIVGLRVAVLIFLGGAFSWWVAIPAYINLNGIALDGDPVALGYKIWSTQIRYLGVGAMLVGGLWALFSIRKALLSAVLEGIEAFRTAHRGETSKLPRTAQDLPIPVILGGIALLMIPVFLIYNSEIQLAALSLLMTAFMLVAGFLFSAVAGYMAGLIGSSNNPISGVTIATILTVSLVLLVIMGSDYSKGAAAAILIGAVVCCAAAIAGDNMQDLNSGYLLGATPKKQQIMQVLGVVAAAFTVGPVLSLLNTAYGFGPKTIEHPNALAAPQANLMSSVAQGVFGGKLPWDMMFVGMGVAVLIILIDLYLEYKKIDFRMPVLAVAAGLYLPFELDSTIFIGGLLAWVITRYQDKNKKAKVKTHEAAKVVGERAGLLFASGLITGEALIGISIAIPVAITGRPDVLALIPQRWGSWPGVAAVAVVMAGIYIVSQRAFKRYSD